MGNPWFIDLLDSVRSELTSLGLNLFLSEAHQLEADSSVLDAFIEARVDGLLFLGTMPVTESLMAAARSMPAVVVSGREPDLPNVDVVSGDDRAGAASAVAHLIDLGHTLHRASGRNGPSCRTPHRGLSSRNASPWARRPRSGGGQRP